MPYNFTDCFNIFIISWVKIILHYARILKIKMMIHSANYYLKSVIRITSQNKLEVTIAVTGD